MERPASWELLGRSNPAGRALYKLFCTDFLGRGQGNCFSDRNRALAELRAARLALTPSTGAARPASVCSKRATQKARPTVCTPKFPSRACRKLGAAPPRGRRPAHAILAAAKVEAVRALAAQPPTPVRVVGEAEKERLAALMQFGRQPPDSAQWEDLGLGRARKHGLQRGLQGELLVLLEQARGEVQERRERLAELHSLRTAAPPAGTAKQARARLHEADALRRDLSERLADLRRVAALLAGFTQGDSNAQTPV